LYVFEIVGQLKSRWRRPTVLGCSEAIDIWQY